MIKIIEVYTTEAGRKPLQEWLDALKDKPTRVRIHDRLLMLQVGHFGDYASVGEGVFELRFFFGAGFRVYFAQYGQHLVLLLCGGDKHTQTKDIQRAKEYWKKFRECIQ